MDHRPLGASYLPRVAMEWPTRAGDSSWLAIDGTLIFVDVSGFTRLSERLARKGREGAEELTSILDARFSELLGIVEAAGGSLLKFGGDALLLFFEGPDHAERACLAGLRMRQAFRAAGAMQTSVGAVRLRMSMGIHSGLVHLFLVGTSHRELLVTGPASTKTVEMESIANAGEIATSAQTAERIDPRLLGRSFPGGAYLSGRRSPDRPSAPPTDATIPEAAADPLASIPTALRDSIRAGGLDHEHRTLSIAFARFSGIDQIIASDPDRAAELLHETVSAIQEAVDATGVTFLGSDLDRDGGKIILLAGAPRFLGDEEDRLLRAIGQIEASDLRLPMQIGAHRGSVFAGEIGPSSRRTYTVIGDAVNLAARLMSNANPGGPLVSEALTGSTRDHFSTTPLDPLQVKGRKQPVEVGILGGEVTARTQREATMLPLAGRDTHMDALAERIDRTRQGHGQVIELTGDVGVGKTRMLQELRSLDETLPMRLVVCDRYEAATPFFAWRVLLRSVLEPHGGKDALLELLASHAPDLLPVRALLIDVLGDDPREHETPETLALAPRFRRERSAMAVSDLLTALSPEPTIFAFDDAHHMDDSSREVLRIVGAATPNRPWLVAIARRATDAESWFPDGVHLPVEPLDQTAARQLIDRTLEDRPIPPHERDALVERAAGNPLILGALIEAARAGDATSVPDSIEAVVGAELDALEPADRRFLREAAVLGATFDRRLLERVLDGSPRDTVRRLDRFMRVDDNGIARFRQRIHRDVAYSALPFKRRRAIHARVATALREMWPVRSEAPLEAISLHLQLADDPISCYPIAFESAENARRLYANVEAVELYERALWAARRDPQCPTDEIAKMHSRLGDAANLAGMHQRSEQAYSQASTLLKDRPVEAASLWLKRARLSTRQGRSSTTLRRASRGLKMVAAVDGSAAAQVRADLTVLYAWTRQQQGRAADALELCRSVLETESDPRATADALLLLEWISLDLGRTADASDPDRALRLLEEAGEHEELAVALNNLGGIAYFRGDWPLAVDRYRRARGAFDRIGDILHAGLATSNLAEILIDQGSIEEASTMLGPLIDLFRASSFQMGAAVARTLQGRAALRSGDPKTARDAFARARMEFEPFERPTKLVEIDAWLAACSALGGEPASALDDSDQVLGRCTDVQTAELIPMLRRVRTNSLIALSKISEAEQEAAAALDAARQREAHFQTALALRLADHVATIAGNPRVDEHDEAARIFTELGVEREPPGWI